MKKRSAASTPRPLEGVTFLVDESVGKGAPRALRERGFSLVVVGEPPDLPTGVDDEVWLAFAGRHGYPALSKDLGTRYHPNEKAAILAGRVRLFQFTRGPWTSEQMVTAFTQAEPRIGRLLKRQAPPFIARISKSGHIPTVLTEDNLRRGTAPLAGPEPGWDTR